jgi:5-methylcytosine-specific restriction endonuclease McrA
MLKYSEQIQHPNWQKCRLRIFERDSFACRICGNTEHQLQVHHLCYFPNTLIWEYDDELLITVCPEHHKQLQFDLPKIAGLIAFKLLTELDINSITKIIDLLKTNFKKVA